MAIRLGFLIENFFRKIIFTGLLLGFTSKSLYFCWLFLTLSLGRLCDYFLMARWPYETIWTPLIEMPSELNTLYMTFAQNVFFMRIVESTLKWANRLVGETTGTNLISEDLTVNFYLDLSLRNCKNCVHNCEDHSFTWSVSSLTLKCDDKRRQRKPRSEHLMLEQKGFFDCCPTYLLSSVRVSPCRFLKFGPLLIADHEARCKTCLVRCA